MAENEEDGLVRHVQNDTPSENLPVPMRVQEGSVIEPPRSPYLNSTGIYSMAGMGHTLPLPTPEPIEDFMERMTRAQEGTVLRPEIETIWRTVDGQQIKVTMTADGDFADEGSIPQDANALLGDDQRLFLADEETDDEG